MVNGDSQTHGLTPQLSFRLFNMTLKTAYKIYTCLHNRHHQQHWNEEHWLKPLTMDQAVEAVSWSFLQKGDGARTRKATHSPSTMNLKFVMDSNIGNKILTDIDGTYDKPVTHNHNEKQHLQQQITIGIKKKRIKKNHTCGIPIIQNAKKKTRGM